MDVDDDPGCSTSVDACQVFSQPLPLSTPWGVVNVWGQVDHMGGANLRAVEEIRCRVARVGRHLQTGSHPHSVGVTTCEGICCKIATSQR